MGARRNDDPASAHRLGGVAVSLGRDRCDDLGTAERCEWLVTNGIGGFASGTVSGALTRRYHGLLFAALHPPLGRTLLAVKLDEFLDYAGRTHPLCANRWSDGSIDPRGYWNIEGFCLEGTVPVWTFTAADALLEKRLWMEPGANTTYVRYTLARGSGQARLRLTALVNYRDYHGSTRAGEWHMRVETMPHGLRVVAFDGAHPFTVLSTGASAQSAHEWYRGFELSAERFRGLDDREDHLRAGSFELTLVRGTSVTIACSADASPDLDGEAALARRRRHEELLLARWAEAQPAAAAIAPPWIRQLVLAADQFVVRRPLADEPEASSIIAGYPWFGDWGRDTMIALPGLTLATGRFADAAAILRTFAGHVSQGMLPNRFPDAGETPEYNTVDATLWYFNAVDAYTRASGDRRLARELYPVLKDIIDWHRRGTRYSIHVDERDSLLYAGEPGVQLTWMDARLGDWVVTPRIGKPIEINALWYNALVVAAGLAKETGDRSAARDFAALAERTRESLAECFTFADGGYLYDVIDTPEGDRNDRGYRVDTSLRPNQLFAVAVPHTTLGREAARRVVDVCARELWTPVGLRSLATTHPAYVGRYAGDPHHRDGSYHQGTVWSWLLGPFARAHYRAFGNARLARTFLEGIAGHLGDACVGSISEVFDGDAPHAPEGCFAQAWSVAEVLAAWRELSAIDAASIDATSSPPDFATRKRAST